MKKEVMLPYTPETKAGGTYTGGSVRVAYLGSYPPRECGIATFCEDLLTSTLLSPDAGEPVVVAMDNGHGWDYSWPVGHVVDDSRPEDYVAAGDFIQSSAADVLSVQHEFGLFGGVESDNLFRLLERVRKPVVTTLHTVLPRPDRAVRRNLRRLTDFSQGLVVMNDLAVDILERDYGLDGGKVAMIHHGALPPSLESREEARSRLGLPLNAKVISTFGLVARGKGLQHPIAAMPMVLERHPEAIYVIVGQTHPSVKHAEKESYRTELEGLVDDLGLRNSVRFVNRYVTKCEIVRYLAATDVYVTPYRNPDQITSGTLAYALAAGTAVVSTPYLYAQFLLGEDRGLLVDFESPEALAKAFNGILDSPERQSSFERSGRIYGQQMYWPVVGAHYLKFLGKALQGSVPSLAPATVQLELTLPHHVKRDAHYPTERRRSGPFARPSGAADGLLRHRTTR
jgi:glycosyltransferase involved in cell wall biosynthesis